MVFLDVLTQMYRKAGVVKHAGQGINGSQQEEGLHVSNSLLDGLKIERLFFYQILRTLFGAVADQADYAVGSLVDNANWEIERPEHILRAGYMIPNSSSAAEIQMRVLTDYTEYQTIVNKSVASSMSWVLYYRASLPTGTATLWPVPSVDFNVAIYTPGTVDEFSDVMSDIQFPKGYREFLEYAGAVALHDGYPDAKMLPNVERKAIEYKSRIKAAQYTPGFMRSDPAALGRPDRRGLWFGAREYTEGY